VGAIAAPPSARFTDLATPFLLELGLEEEAFVVTQKNDSNALPALGSCGRRCESRADWERFVDLYSPLLEHWARRLSTAQEAADLVQDVLILVMEKLPSFAGGGDRSFLAWLRAVMRNRWRDLVRRAAARPCATNSAAVEAVGDENDIDELAETESRNLLVRRAMQIMQSDFEPTTWRACWESVAADRPAAEIAAQFGISVDVVYAANYRVIRRLRAELADRWS
jgi:RNA polymerase sigma-70 factor (ECF subfamily)